MITGNVGTAPVLCTKALCNQLHHSLSVIETDFRFGTFFCFLRVYMGEIWSVIEPDFCVFSHCANGLSHQRNSDLK